jgi:hypothetical protein
MIALPAVAHGFARREEARAEKTSTAECSFSSVSKSVMFTVSKILSD